MKQSFNPNQAIKYGLIESITLEILREKFWIMGGALYFTPISLYKHMRYCTPQQIESAVKTLLFNGKIAENAGKYRLLSNRKEKVEF